MKLIFIQGVEKVLTTIVFIYHKTIVTNAIVLLYIQSALNGKSVLTKHHLCFFTCLTFIKNTEHCKV